VFCTLKGNCTVCPGEADSAALRSARSRFGTCLTVTFKPGPLCDGGLLITGGVVVSGVVVVVVAGGGVVMTGRTGLVMTGVIVEGVEVVAAGRSVVVVRVLRLLPLLLLRGGVFVAICVAGDGPGTGVIVGVVTVREGVVVKAVLPACVAVAGCCCPFLVCRLARVLLELVFVVAAVVAIRSGPVPVICRATGGVVVLALLLFLAVLVAGDGVVMGVRVGAVLVLLVVPDELERAGVRDGDGLGEAVATAVVVVVAAGPVLVSGARAGVSRRAVSNSLS